MGVRLPLTVGKAWGFPSSDVNSTSGVSFERTGSSKVVAQERLITHAGTFDTFKIETSFTERSRKDQTKKYQAVVTDVTATEINLRINTAGQQPIQASAGAILSLTWYNATTPVKCG